MEIPDEVPGGVVDIRVEALEDGPAHLLIGRLNDGVTYEQFEAAPPNAEGLRMITVVGGNGTISAGEDTELTVHLEPGDYTAVNIHGSPPALAYDRFRVVDAAAAAEPDAIGTVTLGPGMAIDAPAAIGAGGRWRFENLDPTETHEAALVRLAPGATAGDLAAWFQSAEGAPPITAELGSLGALGPGQEAWVTIDALAPGEYALVCYVPGADFVPHAATGMIASVIVEAS